MKHKLFTKRNMFIFAFVLSVATNVVLISATIFSDNTESNIQSGAQALVKMPIIYEDISGTYSQHHINLGTITILESEKAIINFATSPESTTTSAIEQGTSTTASAILN